MMNEFKYFCSACGSTYEITRDLMLCPRCADPEPEGKPLKGVLKVVLPQAYKNSKSRGERFNIHNYLPVEEQYFPPIAVGGTPLINALNIEKDLGFDNLYLKFDGLNPTGSYKDRASFLISAFASKFGYNAVSVASTGNAASSMAGIAAAAGQKVFVFMPSSAPKAKLAQSIQYGPVLIPVSGNYDKAFDLSLKFSKKTGCLNRNTAYNPMTIEGKKTASFELVSQLKVGEFDYVFVPVGDGVVLSGIIKGFIDMKFLGLIDSMPKIIGVQAEKSSYIYNFFRRNIVDINYKAATIADSISVDVARNGYTAVEDLRSVKGGMVLVSDDEILEAQSYVSSRSGVFCEPSSAAAFAGFLKIKEEISRSSNVVVMLTGHGLKDIDSALISASVPEAYEPDIDYIYKRLKKNGDI